MLQSSVRAGRRGRRSVHTSVTHSKAKAKSGTRVALVCMALRPLQRRDARCSRLKDRKTELGRIVVEKGWLRE